jgi:hypothetical protein
VYVTGVRNDRGFAAGFVVRAVEGSGNAGPFSNELLLQVC